MTRPSPSSVQPVEREAGAGAHTPGPWSINEDKGYVSSTGEVDHGGFRIDAKDITQLAYVWRSNSRWGTNEPFGAAEAEANAHLIKAAPDLLAALIYLVNAFEHPEATARGRRGILDHVPPALEQARAAIAKAGAA